MPHCIRDANLCCLFASAAFDGLFMKDSWRNARMHIEFCCDTKCMKFPSRTILASFRFALSLICEKYTILQRSHISLSLSLSLSLLLFLIGLFRNKKRWVGKMFPKRHITCNVSLVLNENKKFLGYSVTISYLVFCAMCRHADILSLRLRRFVFPISLANVCRTTSVVGFFKGKTVLSLRLKLYEISDINTGGLPFAQFYHFFYGRFFFLPFLFLFFFYPIKYTI